MQQPPLVIIIAGSKSDQKHYEAIATAAEKLGLEVAVRIGSAHKTAEHVLAFVQQYEAMPRPKVYITVAGRSNALSGFVDGIVRSPVIACPPINDSFGGADIFSSLHMPSGIACAVILDPKNAALYAAKIFSLHNPAVLAKVEQFQAEQRQIILNDDHNLTQ